MQVQKPRSSPQRYSPTQLYRELAQLSIWQHWILKYPSLLTAIHLLYTKIQFWHVSLKVVLGLISQGLNSIETQLKAFSALNIKKIP